MWQRGVAKLVNVVRDKITVLCPHCGREHIHSRHSLGSKEVVAGCHIGGEFRPRCRSYGIPDRR